MQVDTAINLSEERHQKMMIFYLKILLKHPVVSSFKPINDPYFCRISNDSTTSFFPNS